MTDTLTGPSVHDLLLALAGRLDDDLLAWARELAAVGEEDEAIELATAALAAERVVLPESLRAALVAAARAAQTDLDADRALLPGAPGVSTPHRFATNAGAGDAVVAAVTALPPRRLAGCTLHLTWRTTPAGAAPGPLPHPVVLVEADPDRSTDVLAYQLAAELERAHTPASVEVFTPDATLPGYHAAALRTAREIARGTVVPTVLAGGEAPAQGTRADGWPTDRPEPDPVPFPRHEPTIPERRTGVEKDPLVDPLSGPLLATVLDPTGTSPSPSDEPDPDAGSAPDEPPDDASVWLAPGSPVRAETTSPDWEEDWRSGEWAMPPRPSPAPVDAPPAEERPESRGGDAWPPGFSDAPAAEVSLFESPTPQVRPDPPTVSPVREEPPAPDIPLFGRSDDGPPTGAAERQRRGRRRRPEPPDSERAETGSPLFDGTQRDLLTQGSGRDRRPVTNGSRNGHGRRDRTAPDAAD